MLYGENSQLKNSFLQRKILYLVKNKLKIINWIHHDINIETIKKTGLTEFDGFDGYLFVSNWQKYRFIQKFNFDYKICHVLQNGYSSLINYSIPLFKKTKSI